MRPAVLTLGSDNGSASTARRFRAQLGELGIHHQRRGYRDPDSQALIESWFGKPEERELRPNEYQTLDDPRQGIGGYLNRYTTARTAGYRRPHQVRQTLEDHQERQKQAT